MALNQLAFVLAVTVFVLIQCVNETNAATTTVTTVATTTTTEPEKICQAKKCHDPFGYCEDNYCWCKNGYYGKNCNDQSGTCENCTEGYTCIKSGVCARCDPECEHGTCTTMSNSNQPHCRCDDDTFTGPACKESSAVIHASSIVNLILAYIGYVCYSHGGYGGY